MKVVIANYGVGNIRSLSNAFEYIGCDVELTSDPERILAAEYLVLPGVGSFPYCMEKLKEYKLDTAIKKYVALGKPLLGICVGMQMLFDQGDEHGGAEGLGLILGKVIHFSDYATETQQPAPSRMPHIDWSFTHFNGEPSSALNGSYYFVHSFVCVPESDTNVFGTTQYAGASFCSAVISGNLIGVQFHPEKSSKRGLNLLSWFLTLN